MIVAMLLTMIMQIKRSKSQTLKKTYLKVRHSLMPSPPTDATSLPYSKASEPASYSKTSDQLGGYSSKLDGYSSKNSELPPPPPPSQWSHLYSASCTSSSHYEGPTYEVKLSSHIL